MATTWLCQIFRSTERPQLQKSYARVLLLGFLPLGWASLTVVAVVEVVSASFVLESLSKSSVRMFRLCDRHIVIIEGLVEAFDMRQTMLLGTILALCTACTEDPPQIEPTFESISSNVFETSCVDSGCHSASSAAGNLVLEGEGVYDALLNDPCDNPLAIVEGLHRVTPGDETTSFSSFSRESLILYDPRNL